MNRTQARADVRARLADPAVGGLWTDAQITTALARAHAELAPRFPIERASPASVATGATTLPLPAGATLAIEILDGRAATVPHDADRPAPGARPALTWRTLADVVQLSRPVQADEAGTWTILTLATPADPTTDSTPYDLPATATPALVALAAAALLKGRLADDTKRGQPTRLTAQRLVESYEAEAAAIVRAHRRRALGSMLR